MDNIEVDALVQAKLDRSNSVIAGRTGPLHVSVVFAMYREVERIKSPHNNPLGEDFVNVKVDQLRWLFGGDEGWDIVMVDDGCPDGSGQLAEQIIASNGFSANCQVLYLAEAIRDGHPVVSGLGSPDESRKGGAIELGMYESAKTERPGHVVVYTDADLSTHLGQVGLLVDALDNGATCAAGSRREPESVVVKSGARSDRGKIFIYLWKQMLPQLSEIIDSQCGFKGFRAEIVPGLVTDTVDKQFAFDIELLLRCEIRSPGSVARVPVAWIDSEAASTTPDLEPYVPMLQAVARMYRRYSPHDDRAARFVRLIETIDQARWDRLVNNIPQAITDREPMEFSDWANVDANEIERAMRP